MAEQALQEIRVLDLSEGIAGPFCTRQLGGYGADVIKVEKPAKGDKSREVGPFPKDIPHRERSALFLHLNINKKGVTLNLETAVGRKILRKLVKEADILVENFEPGRMSDWGLDYESLEKINPNVVMTSVTPFGQTGPNRDYRSSSAVLDALAGHTYLVGDPKREPLRYPEGVAEYSAGMHATVATMGALLYNGEAGQGQHIDIATVEALASLEAHHTPRWAYLGVSKERAGGRGGPIWPGKVYRCRDGYVNLAGVGTLSNLIPMFGVIGIPELLDPKYETQTQRCRPEIMEELDALIEPWLMEHDRYEIFHALQEVRVQVGVVTSPEDLLADPGYEAREFWKKIKHPEVGELSYPGQLVRMSETEWQASRAPMLGEHNEEVYCGELGYSALELTQLSENGVI